MKLYTPVNVDASGVSICFEDKVMILGSCFADEIGLRMKACGFNVMVNPFGTLYNPESIAKAVARLDDAVPFTEDDCVRMGAGIDRVCSYSHHTSFSRPTAGEFLEVANASLNEASGFWHGCNKVIITLGTAMVWRHEGVTVSNCLKRPASEFKHEMLGEDEILKALDQIVHGSRQYVFTVSPIRHLSKGAHANTISKAKLQLALDIFIDSHEDCFYFPAYEILLDELRDYRFFADDMCHPSRLAVDIIWERFVHASVPEKDYSVMKESERLFRRSLHRSMLK